MTRKVTGQRSLMTTVTSQTSQGICLGPWETSSTRCARSPDGTRLGGVFPSQTGAKLRVEPSDS